MISKKAVAWITHALSLLSTLILIYWTFVFISVTVFGFKIFRENITETFYLSILGILAVLCGSFLLNVMTNISIIAENSDKNPQTKIPKNKIFVGGAVLIASLFVIFSGLYVGDRRNSAKKEAYLVSSAERLYKENFDKFAVMDRYEFGPAFAGDLGTALRLISKQDENFENVNVIVQDKIGKDPVFLTFGPLYSREELKDIKKDDYLLSTNMEEREYLNSIFSGTSQKMRYSSSDGSYELYFPVVGKETKTKFIIYLSEHQKYGKYGS